MSMEEKTGKHGMPCQKHTRIRSKEDSHSKSINIHKVMCVYVTCYNSLKLFNLPSQKLGSIKNLNSYWRKKIIDRYSFTFITNITLSQNDTLYDFNKDSFYYWCENMTLPGQITK